MPMSSLPQARSAVTARGKFRQNFGEIDRADRRPDQVLGIEFAELLFLQQRKND
jgi:hypothetical protein